VFFLKQAILVPGAKPFEEGDSDQDPAITLPELLTYANAGYDIFSITPVKIAPLSTGKIRTGIATEFPYPYVGLVLDRSGMGFRGSMRRAGVIDCNWRGEWQVCIYNSGTELLEIESVLENPNAKAAAQVVFVEYHKRKSVIVQEHELTPTKRGAAWQGSSDKK
jgi:deoxyuridine 5'-triphosphate nucleotidohydrolase